MINNSSKVRYNECWGFVHNGEEYAIAGSTEGTHFFRIKGDNKFEFIDSIQGKFSSTMVVHRDYKTYQNYAYAVCDEGTSSLQIIDLSYLPDSVSLVAENDSTFTRVHNLFIVTAIALMYACSITPSIGGVLQPSKSMEVFSLADPESPLLVYSGPGGIPEVHDAFVRNNIAFLNCGFDGLRVYDFSIPATPVFLQNMSIYQDQGYNHQGWLSPDGTKYIFGDETNGKRLKNCTVDGNNELTIKNYFGTNFANSSVPHNIMISNDFAYVAYYNEGLRIYDIRSTLPQEVAFYDTYTEESAFKMQGAWGIYSELPSGRLIVSDRQSGLYLFDFREDIFSVSARDEIDIYPNPVLSGNSITVRMNNEEISQFTIQVYSVTGQILATHTVQDQSFLEVPLNFSGGVYIIRVVYTDQFDDEVEEERKIVVSD